MVVENKPGGAMTIGAAEALRQPADGYTLFSVTAPIAAAPSLVPTANLSSRLRSPGPARQDLNVLVVIRRRRPYALRVHRLPKTRPRQAHILIGGLRHAGAPDGELFKLETGVQTVHVPYKGNPASDRRSPSTAPTPISSSPPSSVVEPGR